MCLPVYPDCQECLSGTPRETHAAKIILYISGRQARYWIAATATSDRPDRSRHGCFLFFHRCKARSRRVVARLRAGRKWSGSRDWVSYAICSASGGFVLSRDCARLASLGFLGTQRPPLRCRCSDRDSKRGWATWPWRLFARRALIRTPRDCDPAVVALAGSLIASGASGLRDASSFRWADFLAAQKWYFESTAQRYGKTMPSRDVFPGPIRHAAARKQTPNWGVRHDLEKCSDFRLYRRSRVCRGVSQTNGKLASGSRQRWSFRSFCHTLRAI